MRLSNNNGNICLHIVVCRLTTWLECHSGQILVRYEEASKGESAHITLSVLHSSLADTIRALKATLSVTDQRTSFQNSPCWLLLIHCYKWYLDFIIITKRKTCYVQSQPLRERRAARKGRCESFFLTCFLKDGSVSHTVDFEVDGPLKTEIWDRVAPAYLTCRSKSRSLHCH